MTNRTIVVFRHFLSFSYESGIKTYKKDVDNTADHVPYMFQPANVFSYIASISSTGKPVTWEMTAVDKPNCFILLACSRLASSLP